MVFILIKSSATPAPTPNKKNLPLFPHWSLPRRVSGTSNLCSDTHKLRKEFSDMAGPRISNALPCFTGGDLVVTKNPTHGCANIIFLKRYWIAVPQGEGPHFIPANMLSAPTMVPIIVDDPRNPNGFFLTNSIKLLRLGQPPLCTPKSPFSKLEVDPPSKDLFVVIRMFESAILSHDLPFSAPSLSIMPTTPLRENSENQHIYNNTGIFYVISLLLNKNIVLKVSHAHPVNAGLVISPT